MPVASDVIQERRAGTILWRGKWIILAALLVTVGLSIAATALSPKRYEATAIFQINSPNAPPGEATDLANQGLAKNYATVIVSRSFLDRIHGSVAGGDFTTGELENHLKASAVEETGLMELKARGDSPREAQRLATQVADAFMSTLQRDATQRSRRQQQEVQEEIDEISRRIDALIASDDAEADEQVVSLQDARDALRRQSATLLANGVAQGGSATLTAAPTASADPVSPRPVLNVLAGIVLGLLLGGGLVWLRDRVGATLHSADEATEVLRVPVLASVPLRRKASGDPVVSEAYEMLRANLEFRGRGGEIKVVTVGSYNPGEGKTSVVEGVGRAALRGDRRVLIIDGDMRAGGLSARLGSTGAAGLSGLVLGEADPEDAIAALGPGVDLLPAGPASANPPTILYSDRMREHIASFRERYDLVIFDSPPLANLADGAIVASLSDGFVLVARAGMTKLRDVEAGAATVRQTGTPVIGLVLFEPRPVDSRYYPGMARQVRERDAPVSS
jgi:capsular exopolysaccharide synthesis family protein